MKLVNLRKLLYSNTTNVKVKSKTGKRSVVFNPIQIQPMLRLNVPITSYIMSGSENSNTTNVKVKSLLMLYSRRPQQYSNTTNVKVKCLLLSGQGIGLHHSNTTNVKVK